jgi:CspA family cold shock protein
MSTTPDLRTDGESVSSAGGNAGERIKRLTGSTVWFNSSKGFGYIKSLGKEYFVHHSELRMDGYRTLDKEQVVEFEPTMTEKGLAAKNVRPL